MASTAPLISKLHRFAIITPKIVRLAVQCKAAAEGVTEDPSVNVSSARAQLDLLEQLKSSPLSSVNGYETDSSEIQRPTIREQLFQLLEVNEGQFTIPLGKKLKKSKLTISKKRNIKRQAMLNKVGGRNDSVFFATIGAFVILPPFVILAIAILTGYVQLLP